MVCTIGNVQEICSRVCQREYFVVYTIGYVRWNMSEGLSKGYVWGMYNSVCPLEYVRSFVKWSNSGVRSIGYVME